MNRIAIVWKNPRPAAKVEFANGTLADARTAPGADQTIVTVRAGRRSFSFFLRDVCRPNPIFLPQFGVAVTTAGDKRSYADIARDVRQRGGQTALQQIEQEPEESFAEAAAHTRNMIGPTWLGLSRDLRIFSVGYRDMTCCWDWIEPKLHGFPVKLRETNDQPVKYHLMIGRGFACTQQLTRRLEDGVLPILHATLQDGGIRYEITAFVALETRPLTGRNVRGTHFLVADGHGHGHMFTPEQHQRFQELLPEELNRDEETVLCYRVRAVNDAPAPRYAWLYAPNAQATGGQPPSAPLDENGFAKFDSGRVYCVNRLNGQPLRQRETAVLVPAGGAAVFEFFFPHQPLFSKRAQRLAQFNFDDKLAECRQYWRKKLRHGAQLQLPEPRVNEMAQAGLLHLDLVTYGREPRGALAPTIGVYCPIGSESAPIIQFYDSMGWHDVARRSIQYFLEKQHTDGFIQNFGGYMLETGPALWTMGEHWRYTRDHAWVQSITPHLLRGCDFMLRWRERNQRPELRGRGYGLMEGKVADPEDQFRQFMLNGYGYIGLKRVAEMLAQTNPRESRRLAREAESFRQDIRAALFESFGRSPVVPLGDGTWCPSAPPWADDARGPLALYAKDAAAFSHATFFCRDSLLGPQYLILQEVIAPTEPAADWLLNFHAELMTDRNVGLSQPYYCRHDLPHVRRGEVKAFLKTYYNAFASLADRETYSFWEHYTGASPHKTHEEAWFLMQTRWMLWLECGDTLRLLPAVPRAWLENGKRIALENVASYFGPFSLLVTSSTGKIEAHIDCRSNRQPKVVELRLPHPAGAQARRVTGGQYDRARETVTIRPFRDQAKVRVEF